MVQNALPDSLFLTGLCSGCFKRMHRHGGRSMSNTPIGDYDLKGFRPWSEVFVRVYVRLCMSLTVTLTYRCHWFVHLSDEIFVAVIWFAIPVTAIQRVTDGIYMCSMSNSLELDPLLWSWKAPSKTWYILIRSREVYLWARLKIKRREIYCTTRMNVHSAYPYMFFKNLMWMIGATIYGNLIGPVGAVPGSTLSPMWHCQIVL